MAEYSDSNLSETDTRAKLITPALHRCGWPEDMIHREESPGPIIKDGDVVRRSNLQRIDYVLRIQIENERQPIAVALIEAKRNQQPPNAGMEQAKQYALRMNVPFVYSSNGYQFVEYDAITGHEKPPQPMNIFPSPKTLRQRYEEATGFKLTEEEARPMLSPYLGGEGGRRYYQDAAIRATLEKIISQRKKKEPARVLLHLATGAGKTYIAANLLKRIDDAGQMKRALFLCDRDALRTQALAQFQHVFGSDAETVEMTQDGGNLAENARVHIATYQTLGIDSETDEAAVSFATRHYPKNHFSHIIIDECHRSAWNHWRTILDRNSNAVHIGLTATPRGIQGGDDESIAADNYGYFGTPVYTYGLAQGADDGYLALCEIEQSTVSIDLRGLDIDEIMKRDPRHYITGEPITREELRDLYEKEDFERLIILPDRVHAMCADLLDKLTQKYGKLPPAHKTIIFCNSIFHARMVVSELNNIYAKRQADAAGAARFSFVCMAGEGDKELQTFRAENKTHYIAATVDLLSTGVDIPRVANIVFFRYLKSPVLLHQMMGRGARIDEPNNKLSFTVYDYTNATDLMNVETWPVPVHSPKSGDKKTARPPETLSTVDGFDVHIASTGSYIIIQDKDGKPVRVSAEEYKGLLAARLLKRVASADELRQQWANPETRRELLAFLRDGQISPTTLGTLLNMKECDKFDILAWCGYGALPRTRAERAESFDYKNEEWLKQHPQAAEVLRALARCFAVGGIDELENPAVFDTPSVKKAGGLKALSGNDPQEIVEETKKRLLA